MTTKSKKDTPLMTQYYNIKAAHPTAILLFRVGDFYEVFGEDAITASAILGITLTKRAGVELAGFPYHSIETYLPKLIRSGSRVAICEQLEDPKMVKGLVKRGVVELVTPGVVLENNALNAKENIYLASINFGAKGSMGVAFLDASTGEFYCAEGSREYIEKLISSFAPKEVIYARTSDDKFRDIFGSKYKLCTFKLDEWLYAPNPNYEKLCKQFSTTSLKGFGIEGMQLAIPAAGAILSYLEFTEHKLNSHISSISRIDEGEHVWIDRFTIRNLELFTSSGGSPKGSFADTIDRTRTPMGGRLLRRWIALPIRDLERLKRRHEFVGQMAMDREFAENSESHISTISDLERCAARIAAQRVTPRELLQLKESLSSISSLRSLFEGGDSSTLLHEAQRLQPMPELHRKLSEVLYPDPEHNQIAKGGVIASGVDAELDDLRRVALNGKCVLRDIQQREIERTGISSLKISYNNVFGYYIEVRNTHKDKVPEGWIRKQTLTAAERYITAELKEYEEKILGAEEKILAIEQRIYARLIEYISQSLRSIVENGQRVARLDVLLSFARMAFERRYVRPQLDDSTRINIKGGRHPVFETLLPVGEKYIPNDILLDEESQQIIMITGPNMSGKSALLRQTALIILMAQIGSFVPASGAQIGLVDKIFTRVGASDNISQGESTFMVEMLESASILNNISSRSVVFLDEIGRGTSTYDGISIAWSIVEYLHSHPSARAKTLFATHYHELNEMEQICERVKNYHVSVKEVDGTIVFVRKLERGGSEHSFGIHVARLAGMPESVVKRAGEVLVKLEQAYSVSDNAANITSTPPPAQGVQLQMFQLDDPVLIQIRDQIKGLNINELTPLEALNKLSEIKKITGI